MVLSATSSRLNYLCTNIQAEYHALLFGLEILQSIEVKHAEAFGDSLLVVQYNKSLLCFSVLKHHLMHILTNI
jgi:ribonuclease HI